MPQARRWPTPASVQTKGGARNYGTTTSLVDLCHCMALASQAFGAVLGHQRDHVKSAKQAAWRRNNAPPPPKPRGGPRAGQARATMHAPFERQVERKVRPGEGLFSLRQPKFESYEPGMLNSPAVILRQPMCAQRRAKSLLQLHVGNAAARTRTVSAAPFRPNRLKFPGNTAGLQSQRIPQFESDHPSHAVGLADVPICRSTVAIRGN